MRLVLDGVTVEYAEFQLGPVDLALESEIACLVGPNGAGKSTLLGCCAGAVSYSGTVSWGRRVIGTGRSSDWPRVSYVGDTWPKIFDSFAPGEYWHTIAEIRSGDSRAGNAVQGMVKAAFGLATEFGEFDTSRLCRKLSFGTRRKVQIIGGLMSEPDLVMIDEPQNGLDFLATEALSRVLLRERDGRGMSALLASHDLGSVAAVSQSVYAMRSGNVIARIAGGRSVEDLRAALSQVFRRSA